MNRSTWLDWRRGGIGGSDVGAILGLSPWAGPWDVWTSKRFGDDDDEKTEIQAVGDWLEAPIIDWAVSQLDAELISRGDQIEADPPIFRGTLDALIRTPDGEMIIDAKVDGGWIQWADQIPPHYAAQLNHYRWILEQSTGREYRAALAVYHRRIGTRAIYTVPRAPDWPEVVSRLAEWWAVHIVEGSPPDPDSSDACAAALEHLYPTRSRAIADHRIATVEERELVAEYKRLDLAAVHLIAERKQLRNRIRAAIGDAAGLRWTGGRVTASGKGRLTIRID